MTRQGAIASLSSSDDFLTGNDGYCIDHTRAYLRFRNSEVAADFSGQEVVDFAVAGNGGSAAVFGIAPPRMFCAFTRLRTDISPFWSIISWIYTSIVSCAINTNPIRFVDSSLVAGCGTERKGRHDFYPAILFCCKYAHLISHF